MLRKRKKKEKLRGQRTHGKGDTKNRRGAGSRGGRGRAGSHKHKFSLYWKDFVKGHKIRLKPKSSEKTISLEQLQEILPRLLAQKKAVQQGSRVLLDGHQLEFTKVLSTGTVQVPLQLTNIRVTPKAKEKIKAAGGSVGETIEPDAEEETK
ncbi:MAG: uL15 family ribosomal protein [Candidatus Diapherotrites archaeon]|nr:uL15 family ribosomal protein [Candidatus Diapherotrites archaeon]